MELTSEERAILAHVVVDPDAWVAHSGATFGADIAKKHLAAKVKKHRADYEAAVKEPDYKTRAERDAAEGR